MQNISSIFIERLPRRLYCCNSDWNDNRIYPTETAIKHLHIQPNSRTFVAWLLFDLDYPGAALAWEDACLPPPTITVTNPKNGHAHVYYGLQSPVCISDKARRQPICFARDIKTAMLARLKADPSYGGLLAKNPLHPYWIVDWVERLYDLGELHEYLELPKGSAKKTMIVAEGRNNELFETLRQWAYKWMLHFKREGITRDRWNDVVLAEAEKFNRFHIPLEYGEVKSIARSVAKWTWTKFDQASFSERQAARGRLGGRPKTTTCNGEPWREYGISRATYYRKVKSGHLPHQRGRDTPVTAA